MQEPWHRPGAHHIGERLPFPEGRTAAGRGGTARVEEERLVDGGVADAESSEEKLITELEELYSLCTSWCTARTG